MQFALATYYAQKTRPASTQRRIDEVSKTQIRCVYDASLDSVFGAKKVQKELKREGLVVTRSTVQRLMKDRGLSRLQERRRYTVTTKGDGTLHLTSGLVDRQFVASAPNRLWFAVLT